MKQTIAQINKQIRDIRQQLDTTAERATVPLYSALREAVVETFLIGSRWTQRDNPDSTVVATHKDMLVVEWVPTDANNSPDIIAVKWWKIRWDVYDMDTIDISVCVQRISAVEMYNRYQPATDEQWVAFRKAVGKFLNGVGGTGK